MVQKSGEKTTWDVNHAMNYQAQLVILACLGPSSGPNLVSPM